MPSIFVNYLLLVFVKTSTLNVLSYIFTLIITNVGALTKFNTSFIMIIVLISVLERFTDIV